MADSTNTTGVSQQTLDQVLRSGYANINSSIFNTAKSNINPPPLQQITLPPIQITEQNAPNTSIQNRQLTNQFLDVNNRNFNLQSQQIQNQYDLQTQSLQQSQKDAQSRNLMAFGQSNFIDPGDSSRNLSMVTNVNAKVNQEVRNIQNQASIQLNQVATNYATQNMAALNTNRQNDFQDRQFNLSEALQRGAETGQIYDYNKDSGKVENTNKLNLAGKNFDASMTGWYTDFNSKKERTLAARQIDSNLVDSNIKRALTVSDLTGLMPELNSAQTPDGLPNFAFDFTKNTGQLTTQGQLNQASLSQSGYTKNLYDTMNNTGLYNQEVKAKSVLLNAQIDQASTSMAQGEQTRAELDYLKKNPKLWQSTSDTGTDALVNIKVLDDLIKKETDPAKQEMLVLQQQKQKDIYTAEYGDGDSIYYRTSIEKDAKGNITKENFNYIPDALAQHGLNGSLNWTSNDPKKQEGINKMKAELTTEFLSAFNQNGMDTTKAINKLMYAHPNNKELMVGFRSVVKNNEGVEVPSGYEYTKIDMSNLSTQQRVAFQEELQQAKTQGKEGVSYSNTLQTARDIIDKYVNIVPNNSNFKTSLNSTEVAKELKNFGILDKRVLDNGITNGKALTMLLLGSNSSGSKMLTDDANLTNFNAKMNSVQSTLASVTQKAMDNNLKIDGKDVFRQMVNGNDNIQLGTDSKKQPITIPNRNKEDKNIISSMIDWYDQYQTKGIESKGMETLNTILQLNNIKTTPYDANGSALSMEYLFSGNYLIN